MENNLGNKKTMARNIKYYMNVKGVSSQEVCEALGFPPSTFSYWLTEKTYPRIDKIEKMANYFRITKADLVEEHSSFIPLEKISDEELQLIRCYRKATDKEKQSIDFILKDYK